MIKIAGVTSCVVSHTYNKNKNIETKSYINGFGHFSAA